MLSIPSGSYALVLGASSGFGAAAARELSRHGVHIIGVHLDRSSTIPDAERVQQEIRSNGSEAHFFNVNAADAARRSEVLDAVAGILAGAEGASVRLLLHSLAFGALRPFIGTPGEKPITQAQMEMTLDVMASSLIYWTQDVVERGLMRSGGRILALTSSGSRRVLPGYGAVSAAKCALESYCRQLGFELGPRGITANAIEAGVTDTPALRKIPGNDAIINDALSKNPKGRLTTPEDVAKVIAMMASDEAAWINGTTIRVDGGESVVELDWREKEVEA